LKTAKWIDVGTSVGDTLARYANLMGAAKATRASGKVIDPTKLPSMKTNNFAKVLAKYKALTGDITGQAKLAKELGGTTAKKDMQVVKIGDKQALVNKQTGDIKYLDPKKVGEYKVDPEQDPTTKEAMTLQDSEMAKLDMAGVYYDENAMRRVPAASFKDGTVAKLYRKFTTVHQKAVEGRQKEQFKNKLKQQEELSTREVMKFSGFKDTLDMIERIRAAKKGVNTGYFAAPLQRGKEVYWPGGTPANFVALDTLSGSNLLDYIKEKSGTAYSASEMDNVKEMLPNVEQSDEKFLKNLDILEQTIKDKAKSFATGLSQGKDDTWKVYNAMIKKYNFSEEVNKAIKSPTKAPAKKAAPKAGKLRLRRNDGNVGLVSPETADRLLQKRDKDGNPIYTSLGEV